MGSTLQLALQRGQKALVISTLKRTHTIVASECLVSGNFRVDNRRSKYALPAIVAVLLRRRDLFGDTFTALGYSDAISSDMFREQRRVHGISVLQLPFQDVVSAVRKS